MRSIQSIAKTFKRLAKCSLTFSFGVYFSIGVASAESDVDVFEAHIRPVLVETCFRCHGELKSGGKLRVDSREALLKGGESGPAIVSGKPEDSLLIKAIERHDSVSAMPPDKQKALRPDQVAAFVTWIRGGAVWPAKSAKFEASRHWSFEPIREVPVPIVDEQAWMRTSVDAFIRANQMTANVSHGPPATKRELVRRATFDLTGLPPTPEEVDAFESDTSSNAFETVVERLLKSPAYGERWGRHWLDVVRYADTAGETADYPVTLAWRYRNYVIDAFNSDKPYDEFLREQIAGDILATQGPVERYAERVTATGYLAISRRFGFDSENYHHLTIQDTIDTLGQSVLGLSLGCARCHDHKFDPISMSDYYGLYGILDSSRYSFPGSEQKQRVRSMTPLLPPGESTPKWREYDTRVAMLTSSLEKKQQPVPSAILRSLNDLDGDFEMQSPASGGSKGVLVPPWLYEGPIAVTNAAQSPYKNFYPRGKVGISIPGGSNGYRIVQAVYPRQSRDSLVRLFLNLDFRVATADPSVSGSHRFWVGAMPDSPAVEILISSESISLKTGGAVKQLGKLIGNQYYNLQMSVDLKNQTVSGQLGTPGNTLEFGSVPLSADWTGSLEMVVLDSRGSSGVAIPAIEFDNLGVQESPISAVTTELPAISANGLDPASLTKELNDLVAFDGDFECQSQGGQPASPWGPGPNSVVMVSSKSQSPFSNAYPIGEFGLHMPNRGEYDGFGRTVSNAIPNEAGELFASFDFRCANADAGGNGSWRYYLGHGPGNSAAVELFFNGTNFYRRSGDARDAICPIVVGEWYQVQLKLDLKARTYIGVLRSSISNTEFSGQVASGWDGTVDYTFIDSYGHIGGVRPSLDADNFVISAASASSFNESPVDFVRSDVERRRSRVAELRKQLGTLMADVEVSKKELDRLLIDGPFELTYGMAEGTPHNVRAQIRGEPDQPGAEVPRGFIRVLGGGPLSPDTKGSGRLELTQWLTSAENPLTARVMVNRIWQYHFGRGLVKTPNDFGVRGLAPTHPDLLDHLARRFVESGWSIKSMHRLMMFSATYQQSTSVDMNEPSKADTLDTTDLYVRFARRRLSAEEIRDAILAVSGELDRAPAQEHPFPSPTSWGFSQHGPFSAVYDHNKRSIYLMTQRLKRHPFLALFDGADPNSTTAERLGTTVPTQALFFLNDPFVHIKAEKFAARLRSSRDTVAGQIELANRLTIGRLPTPAERTEAEGFLETYRFELASAGLDNPDQKAMAAYLRTLFACNEFLHLD